MAGSSPSCRSYGSRLSRSTGSCTPSPACDRVCGSVSRPSFRAVPLSPRTRSAQASWLASRRHIGSPPGGVVGGGAAPRSAYWDTAGLVLIGAILIFGVVLAGSLVASSGAVLRVRVIDGLAQSATASTTFGVVAWFVVRQRLRPRLFEIRRWMGRLRDAWTREASGGTPADAGARGFELLMEASREVPGWLEARRRTSLSRGWGGLTVLGLLAGGAGGLFIQAGAGAGLRDSLLPG